ncbi:MAG: butyrate kinase [Eubacteriales bacterium]|nr:butyrate kinase [Eubacteriales bacterium]
MRDFRLLVINPGSTSTKLAEFYGEEAVWQATVRHRAEELQKFAKIIDQLDYRFEMIEEFLREKRVDPGEMDAYAARGGILRPLPGGTYAVDEVMLADLRNGTYGYHASNLGALIAHRFSVRYGKPAYIVDPVTVDEMDDVARVTGLPEISRVSIFHALNQKAVARRVAAELGRPYRELNLIVAHLGGGISIGAHRRGRVVDVNNAVTGDGPFSPERAGGLPVGGLVDLCFSGYTKEEVMRRLVGGGGLVAHLGTSDATEVEGRIAAGDEKAKLVYQAMAYQVAKAIGASAVVLEGRVDAIVLTGGLAHSAMLTDYIRRRVEFIAPIRIYPGEEEMRALAEGVLRVLLGEEEARRYGERAEGDWEWQKEKVPWAYSHAR